MMEKKEAKMTAIGGRGKDERKRHEWKKDESNKNYDDDEEWRVFYVL